MLTVKTEIKESPGKGAGIFTLEYIEERKVIWIENPMFYKIIPYYEYERLPDLQKEFIKKYATHYPEESMFYLDLDNTRFINHSNNPNMEWSGNIGYAKRDIFRGEEITCNYVALNPSNVALDFIRNQD